MRKNLRPPLFARDFRKPTQSCTRQRSKEMPESKSRSRKRKAAATAQKGASEDGERDAQSQSTAAPKEERYVPRFAATKRPRTAAACSQPTPPPARTRVRRASERPSTAPTPVDGNELAADKVDGGDDSNLLEAGSAPVSDDSNRVSVSEELDSQMAETGADVPGSSLSQSLPPPPDPGQQPSSAPSPSPSGHCTKQATDGGMNLELLDPLECNEEEMKEVSNDSASEATEVMNIHETDEDTAPCCANIESVTSTAPPFGVADLPASEDTHTLPLPSPPSPTTPHRTHSTPPPTLSHLDPSLPQQLEKDPSPVSLSPVHSLYSGHRADTTKLGSQKVGKGVARDVGGEGECGEEMGGGVEDAVVVGGSSGNLLVTKVTTINEEACLDELLAVREMMDLTARDLLESQLLDDEATVPSCSPSLTNLPPTHTPRGGDGEREGTATAEGSSVLRGLIEELSALNRYVVACKREVEAHRRRRAAWVRSQAVPRGR